jgi:hypothetical protein
MPVLPVCETGEHSLLDFTLGLCQAPKKMTINFHFIDLSALPKRCAPSIRDTVTSGKSSEVELILISGFPRKWNNRMMFYVSDIRTTSNFMGSSTDSLSVSSRFTALNFYSSLHKHNEAEMFPAVILLTISTLDL